ncbi:MAG: hypothetical protein J6E46_01460 [Faecalicoccus sp.]|nr:hypothetical protein [Faecalicoccus sp.]
MGLIQSFGSYLGSSINRYVKEAGYDSRPELCHEQFLETLSETEHLDYLYGELTLVR